MSDCGSCGGKGFYESFDGKKNCPLCNRDAPVVVVPADDDEVVEELMVVLTEEVESAKAEEVKDGEVDIEVEEVNIPEAIASPKRRRRRAKPDDKKPDFELEKEQDGKTQE